MVSTKEAGQPGEYSFKVREDVDCMVTAACSENPALMHIGEQGGFDAVMQTLLVAGCMYMRGARGIQPADDAAVIDVAKAAQVLGFALVTRPDGSIVVATPDAGRPVGVVERDARVTA
ncbi:hypothetical protein [Methyloversatilis sp. XJ19-49]|uniref:hypothetical protein n=1 Tax=Methyloversatilis sp. XJ19-49 TaxID=2963429 RepID=UPI00211CEC0E|nr:hypothetical protein [Methyloversatilis sp. XJ19-49]MCQ9378835.1 hypothetical protein [Methyloversatilis sp. XJ19-49]